MTTVAPYHHNPEAPTTSNLTNLDENTEYEFEYGDVEYKYRHDYRNSLALSESSESTDTDFSYSFSDEGASNYFTRGSLLGQRLLSFALSSRSLFDDFFKEEEGKNNEEKVDIEDESQIDRTAKAVDSTVSVDFQREVKIFDDTARQRQQQLQQEEQKCCFDIPLRLWFVNMVQNIKEESSRNYCVYCGKVILSDADGNKIQSTHAPLARDMKHCTCNSKKTAQKKPDTRSNRANKHRR